MRERVSWSTGYVVSNLERLPRRFALTVYDGDVSQYGLVSFLLKQALLKSNTIGITTV